MTVPPLPCEIFPKFMGLSQPPIPDKALALIARVEKTGNVEAFIEIGDIWVVKCEKFV